MRICAPNVGSRRAPQQVERADRFAASFRELVAAAIPTSEAQRLGLQRIAATVDQVPFLTWCNLSNLTRRCAAACLT